MNDDNKDIKARLRQKFEDELQKAISGVSRPNVLLLGKTGVGKSSLVNLVFGSQLAAVSNVRPETDAFVAYSVPHVPVNIIDSAGYELRGEAEFIRELDSYVARNFSDTTRQIHICWYCISIGGARVTPFDIETIQRLRAMSVPVCVVLTQADLDTPQGDTARALKAVVDNSFGGDVPCFEVSNVDAVNKEIGALPRLVAWSAENISDDNLRLGFIAAQRVSLKEKDAAAERRVRWYAASAAGVGATPIPVSDTVVLTGLQMKMSADIYTIYGLENNVRKTVTDFIQGRIASAVGKLAAGSAIKAIPGAGSIAGAAINATVAASITYGLGRSVAAACSEAVKAILDGKEDKLEHIFDAASMLTSFAKFASRFKSIKK